MHRERTGREQQRHTLAVFLERVWSRIEGNRQQPLAGGADSRLGSTEQDALFWRSLEGLNVSLSPLPFFLVLSFAPSSLLITVYFFSSFSSLAINPIISGLRPPPPPHLPLSLFLYLFFSLVLYDGSISSSPPIFLHISTTLSISANGLLWSLF